MTPCRFEEVIGTLDVDIHPLTVEGVLLVVPFPPRGDGQVDGHIHPFRGIADLVDIRHVHLPPAGIARKRTPAQQPQFVFALERGYQPAANDARSAGDEDSHKKKFGNSDCNGRTLVAGDLQAGWQVRQPKEPGYFSGYQGTVAHTIPRCDIAVSMDKNRFGCNDQFRYSGVMRVFFIDYLNGVESVFFGQGYDL